MLKDGVILMYYGDSSAPRPNLISVDVNGAKGPNKWGYDLFLFEIRSSASKPLYLWPAGQYKNGCMPVEKGGMSASQYMRNFLYK